MTKLREASETVWKALYQRVSNNWDEKDRETHWHRNVPKIEKALSEFIPEQGEVEYWVVLFRFSHKQPWDTFIDHSIICSGRERAIRLFDDKHFDRLQPIDNSYEELEKAGLARCVRICNKELEAK